MSYDVRFKVKVDGTEKYISVGDCDANITWNVRKIIEQSTGLPWHNEQNNGYCKDIIPAIACGLVNLTTSPENYKQYESPNGWGTVEGTKRFFEDILRSWERFCCETDQEIVDVTTFWIE